MATTALPGRFGLTVAAWRKLSLNEVTGCGPTIDGVAAPREELHKLVEQLPDEQVQGAAADLKARLAPVREPGSWPPAWFGIVDGSANDVSEQVEEILAEGLGRRS